MCTVFQLQLLQHLQETMSYPILPSSVPRLQGPKLGFAQETLRETCLRHLRLAEGRLGRRVGVRVVVDALAPSPVAQMRCIEGGAQSVSDIFLTPKSA